MALATDDSLRYCGYLDLDISSGAGKQYDRQYFILDPHEKQLLFYPEDPKFTNVSPLGYFNLNYLSMVEDAANFKAKNPLCFVLTIQGESHYLKARNDDEKLAWIEQLQNTAKIKVLKRASLASQTTCTGVYETEVAGGVVIRNPCPSNDVTDSDSDDDSIPDRASQHSSFVPSQKALKRGYCTKQGVFMKTWKKRWFVLADGGLAYYRSHEVKSPIRVIPRQEIIDARRSIGIHIGRSNLFEVVTPTRVFYIQAESSHDCDDWIQEVKNLLNPARRRSEAVIQTDHSGTINRAKERRSLNPSMTFGKETSC